MDILGIGNALLDIFWFTDDESALSLGLHPNHAAHVTPNRLDEILLAVQHPICVSGGSASNALKAAGSLGLSATFIGCLGMEDREKDRWARIFESDLAQAGVQCRIEYRNRPTGRCLVIWMPGGMKSIACSPSAAVGLKPENIPPELVAQAKIILLDGQVLRNAEVANHVAILARAHRIPLAIDMGAADIAQTYADTLADLLERNDLILLMNADEAESFARAIEPSLGDAAASFRSGEGDYVDGTCAALAKKTGQFPCIVEKRGPKGARAWVSGKRYVAEAEQIEDPLDDTGAGDVFDGAFLAAFLGGIPVNAALRFANNAARAVLKEPGSRLDPEAFGQLRDSLASIKERRASD